MRNKKATLTNYNLYNLVGLRNRKIRLNYRF